jgi:hypothetical protein
LNQGVCFWFTATLQRIGGAYSGAEQRAVTSVKPQSRSKISAGQFLATHIDRLAVATSESPEVDVSEFEHSITADAGAQSSAFIA